MSEIQEVLRSRPPDPGSKNEMCDKKLRQRTSEALKQDLLKVKAENITLYGRIRGYKTLGKTQIF
jgi:hypothetical protein